MSRSRRAPVEIRENLLVDVLGSYEE